MIFKKVKALRGEVTIPGDKSISHRAVMFGSLAKGTTEVTNFLQGADCLSTIDAFRNMGIEIENTAKGSMDCARPHRYLTWVTAVPPPG